MKSSKSHAESLAVDPVDTATPEFAIRNLHRLLHAQVLRINGTGNGAPNCIPHRGIQGRPPHTQISPQKKIGRGSNNYTTSILSLRTSNLQSIDAICTQICDLSHPSDHLKRLLDRVENLRRILVQLSGSDDVAERGSVYQTQNEFFADLKKAVISIETELLRPRPTFMSLPVEIRLQIYRHLLEPKGKREPFASHLARYEAPWRALYTFPTAPHA